MNKLIPVAALAAVLLAGCAVPAQPTAPEAESTPAASPSTSPIETAAFVASDTTICAQLMGTDNTPGPLPVYLGVISNEIAEGDQATINKGLEAEEGVIDVVQRADPELQAITQAILSLDDTERKAGLLEIVSRCDYDVDDLFRLR